MHPYQIIRLGNPALRLVSKPFSEEEFGSTELKNLAETLFKIMHLEKGIGLAAPQIGVTKRAIVFGMDKHPVHSHYAAIPFTLLLNPSFIPLSDTMVDAYEGCLSAGNLRGKVSRYQSILYKGYDVDGKLIEREVADLHARVFQHEYDHLNGEIFLDKIKDLRSLGFHDELLRAGLLPEKQVE